MHKLARILVVTVLLFTIAGCSDKLTEKTAKDVLVNEWLAKQPQLFTSISFEKGSPGFAYFQQLISNGSFKFIEKEDVWNILSRGEPMYKSVYAPTDKLAGVYESLEIEDKLNVEGTPKILGGDGGLKRTVVCTVSCRIKKKEIQTVEAVLNEEEKGLAKVKFSVTEVPVSPQYEELSKLANSDPKAPSKEFRLREPYRAEVQLKKYDEGWKID